jgi:hypothetical protein
MGITNTGKMRRRPTHPGEMLREDFLPDFGLTVASSADALGVFRQTVNELLTVEVGTMPLRLAGNHPLLVCPFATATKYPPRMSLMTTA